MVSVRSTKRNFLNCLINNQSLYKQKNNIKTCDVSIITCITQKYCVITLVRSYFLTTAMKIFHLFVIALVCWQFESSPGSFITIRGGCELVKKGRRHVFLPLVTIRAQNLMTCHLSFLAK
jgi:hypothetical protein